MNIRIETQEENRGIFEIHKRAFGREDEAKLVDLIRETEQYVCDLSLVAETLDGQLVGHALLSEIFLEREGETRVLLGLAPVSVLPEFQGEGVGSALIEEGIRLSRAKAYPGIIVLGHASYYPKFGFKKAADFGISAPFDVPEENFLALELYPGGLTDFSGEVRYPDAFNQV
ncbi:GNAT family N-acetyltransferase [Listeria sp. ILCC792]|uniref:GNAT family N-acetyltransferase n=1 Tax=Listeria sp. ILCC792 TaxID=1918331 RepID=UPI000B58C014|nr:N-acetyltransferase [Listeria sp. ILCC792]